jgi:mannose-6-phosphate isomerase-like protein (cupin superfamily)
LDKVKIENWNVLGMFVRIVWDAGSTEGSDLFDATLPPGGGTPRHVHSVETESFYVIDGVVTFNLGDETIHAHPGTFVIGVPGVPHAFRNETSKPARMICTSVPGGRHARFFREVGERLPDTATQAAPVEFTQELMQKVAAASERMGIQLLG